ncbi:MULTISPECIES: YkvA family protein [unclassified Lysinibacillus]|uniref:YkvA family protein n=1 Tax=unclassified Lysinibacillus TaxID=2636778 RepID=UPI0025541600|nr:MULTISPECIES: YkvA family protein [unclassified Lysinibacillus]MDM5248545.1 YkvA family protein [Lysinibacillus sp. G4S2]
MKNSFISKLKAYAKSLKQNLFVLYLSYKDPRTPWYAKLLAMFVVAYAFSPIDLIPDFIPVLGFLDDLIIVPLGIILALKLIPPHVIEDNKEAAEKLKQNGKPKNWFVGVLFIIIWIIFAVWISNIIFHHI